MYVKYLMYLVRWVVGDSRRPEGKRMEQEERQGRGRAAITRSRLEIATALSHYYGVVALASDMPSQERAQSVNNTSRGGGKQGLSNLHRTLYCTSLHGNQLGQHPGSLVPAQYEVGSPCLLRRY